MRKILFKRKTWKRLGLSLLSLLLVLGAIFAYYWVTFIVLPDSVEEVQFESNGITISGSLIFPDDQPGPFPAVIILHGSRAATRSEIAFTTQARAFIKKGFAVFIYDKRGTGESEGIFQRPNYENLMVDIKNAIDFLQSKPAIIPGAIGLATNSESGYFAPQLASERPDLAFIYNRVAPVVSNQELVMYQMRIRMSEAYENPEDVDEIMELLNDYRQFFIKSDGDIDYFNRERAALEKRMAASWTKYAPNPLPYYSRIRNNDTAASEIHRIGFGFAYDPRIYFEKAFDTPMFYAFAEKDLNVPTEASVASLEKIMERNEHQIEYKVWPNVAHGMVKVVYVFSGGHPPGYLHEMASWARRMVDRKMR
ncbi:MAG: alpha/beta hydrolase [Roseivirga sp.]|nr:alpha/beta hydrolase [Roseivirga sp.]